MDKNYIFSIRFLWERHVNKVDLRVLNLASYLCVPAHTLTLESGVTLYQWAEVKEGTTGYKSLTNGELISFIYRYLFDVCCYHEIAWSKTEREGEHEHRGIPPELNMAAYSDAYGADLRKRILDWWTTNCDQHPPTQNTGDADAESPR